VIAALQTHARLIVVTVACTMFGLVILPMNVGLGTNTEEMVGLVDVAPERLYPERETVPPSEASGRAGFRTSNRLPVFGYVRGDGSFLPLMIDGHVGALSFYGVRLLADVGGLNAARLHSTVLGVLAILLVYAFARRLGGERVGLVAVLLAGTSPHLMLVFSMIRPDEQLHSFAHLAALLAFIRFAGTRHARWLYLAGLLLGLGVAAKNTAGWALVAIAIAALCFHLVPRARARDWAIAAGLFLVPLVPQLLYLFLADSRSAFSARMDMVSNPLHSLAPGALLDTVERFADGVGHGGSLVGSYFAGGTGQAPAIPGVGIGLFVAALLAVAATFSRASTLTVRAFGAGLGLLLLQHFAFYYRGEAYFSLCAPWIPIAVALAGVGLWNSAATLQRRALRTAAQAAVVAAGLAIFASNGAEAVRYHRGVAKAESSMFSRPGQEFVSQYLESMELSRPFVTTYGAVGLYEFASRGRVRPRYLFPYFHAVADGGEEDYKNAWVAILRRLGPGQHTIVLSTNPSPLDTSPCKRGELIALRLWYAVQELGGDMRGLAEFGTDEGTSILVVVRVTLHPASAR
jgi:hypothetical protein